LDMRRIKPVRKTFLQGIMVMAFKQIWQGYNDEYFDGELVIVPQLVLSEDLPRRVTDGEYRPGPPPQYVIRKNITTGAKGFKVKPGGEFKEGRQRLMVDILLRLMTRQWCQQHDHTDPSSNGYGSNFRRKALEVSERLGLAGDIRYSRQPNSDMTLPIANTWPVCLRPPDYYMGALKNGK
jgi:hypothetical protein